MGKSYIPNIWASLSTFPIKDRHSSLGHECHLKKGVFGFIFILGCFILPLWQRKE